MRATEPARSLPELQPVLDPEDPRVRAFRNVRERDLTRADGFIAEGEVVLRALARSPLARPTALLLLESRVAALADVIATLPADVPVHVAAREVLDGIVGFPIHRGVLAIGHRHNAPDAESLLAGLPRRAVVVVLVGIANHDNIGGIFRNAAAFGADAVLLDPTCCDPLYRKAIRVSVGAALLVPFARTAEAGELPALLARHDFETVALSPAGALDLPAYRPADRVALLFGTEGPGLPADLLAQARTVRIAMAGGFDSLNVATTSGIVLHHVVTAPR